MDEGADRQLDGWLHDERNDSEQVPVALTLAGSDCSGGAGIQADLKTFAAHGVYGESVIVSVVAENTEHVVSAQDIDPHVIGDQIDAVFEDVRVDAVKVGMLPTRACMEAVAAGLARWKPRHVVLDPIVESTSGTPLMDLGASEYFEEQVLPKATVVTPNIPEAERLVGFAVTDEESQTKACQAISERAEGAAVLVKGGHAQDIDGDEPGMTKASETAGSSLPAITGESVDILWDGTHTWRLVAPRFDTESTHGTGCTLSSAITANLALGKPLLDAVKDAKSYITGAIAYGLHLGHGHGPTNHFHYLYRHGLKQTGPLPDDIPKIRCEEIAL